jgi:ABC-2 type transport system permease protein
MVGTILGFEVRQRLRRISTYIYIVVMAGLGFFFVNLAGGAIAGGGVDFGTGGKVMLNSPYALNQIIGYMSFFGVIITAALAGQATYQDVDSGTTAFFYTAPITKFDYLAGRFCGCLAIQVLIFASVGLGVWIGTLMPWLDQTRLGPQHAAAYFQPYLLLVIPNLIITSAIFFALAALGRKMLPVYAGSVLLLIGYFVAVQLAGNITVNVRAALVDPFGGNAIDRITQYWTPFERNTRLIPLAGILLLNRALWLGFGAAILALAYAKFSFSQPKQRGKRKLLIVEEETAATAAMAAPVLHPEFSFGASLRQLVSLTRLQFSETVKNVFFGVLVFAGTLFAVIAAGGVFSVGAIRVYPLTYQMLAQAGGGFTLFALAIITFYAGELVWRERDAQINQIVDALPVQRWVLFGSKLGALMLVQIVLVFVILAAGLFVQVTHGYYRFELGHYFRELFGIRLIQYWILCVLALFIHTLVNQKYLGHFVVVLYYIATLAAPPMGFQHYLYRLGQSPAFVYSDMNGYGPFVRPLFWFHLYWAIFAVMLAIVTNLLWVRGIEGSWRGRLKLAGARLTGASRLGLAVCALLFAATGGYIFYNTNILNTYRTTSQNDELRAQYEKKYRQYVTLPEPRLTDLNVQDDLDPERLTAKVQGRMWMENKTDAPMDLVALSLWPSGPTEPHPRPHIEVERLNFAGGQTAVIEDPALGFYLYRLAAPLAPHERVALDFSINYPNPGFVNANPNTDIAHNGSFIDGSYVPYVGYSQFVELTEDGTRHRHGLEKAKRLAKLEDVAARQNNADATESDWVNFEGTVSTSPDQIAILPGYLQKEWTQDGRRYFHYKMDAPILGIASMNSGRYEVQRDHWRDVNLEIYYQRGHEFDLERMNRGMKATLDYCTAAFSPYQFRQVRIIEFPRYDSFAESFPNTIPFSESIGFITYVPAGPDAIDLPFYVTAHEVAHQWWGHQVDGANVEGETSIVETLAQYSALMVMQHTYGAEAMKKFLRVELDNYLRGRATERNEERPLYKVEPNQGYIHYRKGSLVMYALQDYIGETAVNQALAEFVKAYAFKGPPYAVSLDLIAALRKHTPPEFQYLYEDLFENITIYDNRAVAATYVQQAGGKYQVHLTVEAKKNRADGRGQEQAVPLHDWIDIGVQDKDGHYLYLQKQMIDRSKMEFDLTVDKTPALAGIDPINKLIDRSPDDNVIKVEKR